RRPRPRRSPAARERAAPRSRRQDPRAARLETAPTRIGAVTPDSATKSQYRIHAPAEAWRSSGTIEGAPSGGRPTSGHLSLVRRRPRAHAWRCVLTLLRSPLPIATHSAILLGSAVPFSPRWLLRLGSGRSQVSKRSDQGAKGRRAAFPRISRDDP